MSHADNVPHDQHHAGAQRRPGKRASHVARLPHVGGVDDWR